MSVLWATILLWGAFFVFGLLAGFLMTYIIIFPGKSRF